MITGITGQDGAYLARSLIGRGYRVIGTSRNSDLSRRSGLRRLGIEEQIEVRIADLADPTSVAALIRDTSPDELYNLSAASSVANSFCDPRGVFEFNSISVSNLLESIRTIRPETRFYQASSSEMFAASDIRPITRDLGLRPLSPYGCSKAAGHHLTSVYRDCYGLFAVSGILFNHESTLRPETYFVKKVIRSALRIHDGSEQFMTLGNLNVRRDIGLAEHYVEAMWLMLQQPRPRDQVVCSGTSVCLRDIVDRVLQRLGLDSHVVRIRSDTFRPTDAADIFGDPEPARNELGWNYRLHPLQAVDSLLDEEIALNANQVPLDKTIAQANINS